MDTKSGGTVEIVVGELRMAPGGSNLRTQVRSLPLYPLSYGAARGQYAPRPAAILCASRWR